MSKIIYTVGIQGSGKSFWAKEFCLKNKDWVRVNRDDLRNMRGQYWIPKQEDMISHMEYECIKSALMHGYNVVIDAMNLNPDKVRARMEELKNHFPSLTWEKKDFTHVPLDECLKNDLKRPNSIGEKVIRDTYNRYFPKTPIIQNPDLPKAIIVDIDGTLALMKGRSPFDWHRVGEDEINEPVAEIVRRFKNTHEIILLSGRDSVCRAETHEWLVRNKLQYDYLWMRPNENTEKDTIVKRRLYEDHIKDNYFVDFVIDDRLQVCRLWHELGFKLLRMGDPDADF